MRFSHLFRFGTAIAIPLLTSTVFAHPLIVESAVAQNSPDVIQTTLTESDRAILEMLLQRAYARSASIRELRADQVTSLLESVEIESQLNLENQTEIILKPIDLFNGLIRQPAISAQLREQRAAIRVEILEIYAEYIHSRQARHSARLAFEEVIASIASSPQTASTASSMIANAQRSGETPNHHQLTRNRDYVDAANELFAAQTSEMLALEKMAGLVDMTPAEILTVLEGNGGAAIATPPPQLQQ